MVISSREPGPGLTGPIFIIKRQRPKNVEKEAAATRAASTIKAVRISWSDFLALLVFCPSQIESPLLSASDPLCHPPRDFFSSPHALSLQSSGYSGSFLSLSQVVCPLLVSSAITSKECLREPTVLAALLLVSGTFDILWADGLRSFAHVATWLPRTIQLLCVGYYLAGVVGVCPVVSNSDLSYHLLNLLPEDMSVSSSGNPHPCNSNDSSHLSWSAIVQKEGKSWHHKQKPVEYRHLLVNYDSSSDIYAATVERRSWTTLRPFFCTPYQALHHKASPSETKRVRMPSGKIVLTGQSSIALSSILKAQDTATLLTRPVAVSNMNPSPLTSNAFEVLQLCDVSVPNVD
ncbi:hypothetical protein Nepgr_006551 [Nepenthes gracilis]|uniref:Uncharacterized protein n=1 Tax=Nepenthes gracilis TaxID=150966 RepID=A0AAD3XHQ0_NEPGR|nr:hypothetical protein Nepgr_006551 [Nepenthes gracilis]